MVLDKKEIDVVGMHCEVLAPASLRAELKMTVEKLYGKYFGSS